MLIGYSLKIATFARSNYISKYLFVSKLRIIDEKTLVDGINYLIDTDLHLRQVIIEYGSPPLWRRPQGFSSLLKIILEQQVSLASAQSTYNKLLKVVEKLTPERFLTLSDDELNKIGFSRQKSKYCRVLAKSILEKYIDLDELNTMDDEQVFKKLTSLKGIGPWTADIYSIMVLGRPDIWPLGDLALLRAMKEVKGLDAVPDNESAYEIALTWSPWRSVAARILWHHYLSKKRFYIRHE